MAQGPSLLRKRVHVRRVTACALTTEHAKETGAVKARNLRTASSKAANMRGAFQTVTTRLTPHGVAFASILPALCRMQAKESFAVSFDLVEDLEGILSARTSSAVKLVSRVEANDCAAQVEAVPGAFMRGKDQGLEEEQVDRISRSLAATLR